MNSLVIENDLPLVSVIIPVYNGVNYLRDAIESVLAQTYSNYELIVVDDGSTDDTWNMILSYGKDVKGIHKKNGGVASALNCGIKLAEGKYIAWLSHDDLFLPEKLEHQVRFLQEHPQFKACYSDYILVDAQGHTLEEIETPWYPRQEALLMLFRRMYINGSTMLINRICFDKVGLFNEELRYTQDAEMWLRILTQFEIGRVPDKHGKQRTHSTQGSKGIKPHLDEQMEMYSNIIVILGIGAFFPEFTNSSNQPRTLAFVHTWLADTFAQYRGWYGYANRHYMRSLKIYSSPRNPAWIKLYQNNQRRFVRKAHFLLRSISNNKYYPNYMGSIK
jgi:glycosyltransferase involved in cell wall biosynthesis